MNSITSLCVNESRFRANFEALSRIGATGDGGVHRPALSEDHLRARAWFAETARQAGLGVSVDGAGNHSARLDFDGATQTLLLGSHLDSVVHGGRFDGPLGVLCALEVVQTIKDAGLTLPVNLEAIDLTDEEGAHVSFMGSRAATGKLHAADLDSPHQGVAVFRAGLERAGLTPGGILAAKRDPASLAGYLEVHIEQGPRLMTEGLDIGVVTNIVGIHWYRLKFVGQANHSGTTPMDQRRDAAQGACAFAVAAREVVMRDFAGAVVNVGLMDFEPGAFNVVPGVATAALEFRSPDAVQLLEMRRVLLDLARDKAAQFTLDLEVTPLEATTPVPMDTSVQKIIHEAAGELGLTHRAMHSGAGHDAQNFADLCPTGMLFVPSVGGISHSPEELSRWQDCVNGANVLLHTVLKMSE